MPYTDLQDYVAALDRTGQLHRITTEVDPVLEITEIADRLVKSGGPAVLCERVRNSPYPVAINLFGTRERTHLALETTDLDAIARRVDALIPRPTGVSLGETLKMVWDLKGVRKFKPKTVRSGVAGEVSEPQGRLTDLPVLQCWPDDAGRFMTLPLVITRHPETGRQNIGMYRIQLIDERRALMHWHVHHDGAAHHRLHSRAGRDMEVAIALGCDPATIYAATAPLPPGIDELLFAGFLRNAPVEVMRAATSELLVPAHAEFILEGTVSATETMLEGPFGDHTGFYSPADQYPVFTLKTITRRTRPIYPATIVGRPPMEDYWLGKATERIFLPLLKLQIPEIIDINFPCEGVFHNCVLVSIRKEYPGQARKVASALWGLGQMMFTKCIVVFDADTDVQHCSESAWKAFSNVDPERDLFTCKGPLDVLDHSAPEAVYGAKVGIDATRPLPGEGHTRDWPAEITMTPEMRAQVSARWHDYGF